MTTDLVRSALQSICAVTALLCSFATFVFAQQSSGYSDTITLPPYYPGNPPALVLGGIESPRNFTPASSVAYPHSSAPVRSHVEHVDLAAPTQAPTQVTVQLPAVQGVVPAPVQVQVFAQPVPIEPAVVVAQRDPQNVKPSEGAQPSRGQDTPPAQPREVKQAVVVPAQQDSVQQVPAQQVDKPRLRSNSPDVSGEAKANQQPQVRRPQDRPSQDRPSQDRPGQDRPAQDRERDQRHEGPDHKAPWMNAPWMNAPWMRGMEGNFMPPPPFGPHREMPGPGFDVDGLDRLLNSPGIKQIMQLKQENIELKAEMRIHELELRHKLEQMEMRIEILKQQALRGEEGHRPSRAEFEERAREASEHAMHMREARNREAEARHEAAERERAGDAANRERNVEGRREFLERREGEPRREGESRMERPGAERHSEDRAQAEREELMKGLEKVTQERNRLAAELEKVLRERTEMKSKLERVAAESEKEIAAAQKRFETQLEMMKKQLSEAKVKWAEESKKLAEQQKAKAEVSKAEIEKKKSTDRKETDKKESDKKESSKKDAEKKKEPREE